MATPADLLRDARITAGLSIRELAECAGVAASTVVRIESGQVDPTIGMLSKLLEITGCHLSLAVANQSVPSIANLSTEWRPDADGQPRPRWTAFRAFLDQLHRHPEWSAPSTSRTPAPSGSLMIDNLLAGIAEKIRDDCELPRPKWVGKVRPDDSVWISPGTPRLQKRARATTPPQLAARNIFLTADSLWRIR